MPKAALLRRRQYSRARVTPHRLRCGFYSSVKPGMNESCSLEGLINATDAFFAMHWCAKHGTRPKWECWQPFLYGSVPNYLHPGCYAIFSDSQLVYVGLGASKGGGRYPERGISRRLMGHVLRSDPELGRGWSKLTEARKEASSIHTIGFRSAEHLAAALETYLIRELAPFRNARV